MRGIQLAHTHSDDSYTSGSSCEDVEFWKGPRVAADAVSASAAVKKKQQAKKALMMAKRRRRIAGGATSEEEDVEECLFDEEDQSEKPALGRAAVMVSARVNE